ncbi:MAG TPA: hypothetical protein VEP28_14900 [Rubrobacter sp.]|nr:hypothetical protein [Rubrobacter sp.]
MDDWAMIQTWRQRSEDLRREAETYRLARTLRNGSPGRYRWIPVLWWKLSRYGGRVLKSFGQRCASV